METNAPEVCEVPQRKGKWSATWFAVALCGHCSLTVLAAVAALGLAALPAWLLWGAKWVLWPLLLAGAVFLVFFGHRLRRR